MEVTKQEKSDTSAAKEGKEGERRKEETEAQWETERSGKQRGDVDLVRLVPSGRRNAAVDVGTPAVRGRGARRPPQGVAGHRFLFAVAQWRSR